MNTGLLSPIDVQSNPVLPVFYTFPMSSVDGMLVPDQAVREILI